MKPINIYALTRQMKIENISRLERQMSGRKYFIAVKNWEIDSLRKFLGHLEESMPLADDLRFFYSFQIPKLGKEFDLLRISEDTVVNIELKSKSVPDEQIKKQLEQNRYYLSTLGLNMRSYTYISTEDRLLRLTGGGNVIETGWQDLCDDLDKQELLYEGDIEELFKEEQYIISPLADPERFLQKEYFLTSQQRDIERKIIARINGKNDVTGMEKSDKPQHCLQGFSGLPGTGKTLLLYDIAMRLSERQRVAVFHCAAFTEELRQLDERLKRIDFIDGMSPIDTAALEGYSALLVDEAHKMPENVVKGLIEYSGSRRLPVVFCYDNEDSIEEDELIGSAKNVFENLNEYTCYRLTNRIRANSELSAFIQCIMQGSSYNHRKDYPSVQVAYAGDVKEAGKLIDYYIGCGYAFIYDDNISKTGCEMHGAVEVSACGRQEYDGVVMLMDESFYYEILGGLRSKRTEGTYSSVRNLFHGLSRAKQELAVVVMNNEPVMDVILSILQGSIKRT